MTSMLIVGVGGQGAILLSKILTHALVDAAYDVKMSEVHGMAQRGGSVSTQIRFGSKVLSPIVGKGAVDVLVSLEEMESARYVEYLNSKAKVIINAYRINPISVSDGSQSYPEGLIGFLGRSFETHVAHAAKTAEELGNPKCMNVVLLGYMSHLDCLKGLSWEQSIKACVPPKHLDLNLKAFEAGRLIKW